MRKRPAICSGSSSCRCLLTTHTKQVVDARDVGPAQLQIWTRGEACPKGVFVCMEVE